MRGYLTSDVVWNIISKFGRVSGCPMWQAKISVEIEFSPATPPLLTFFSGTAEECGKKATYDS